MKYRVLSLAAAAAREFKRGNLTPPPPAEEAKAQNRPENACGSNSCDEASQTKPRRT